MAWIAVALGFGQCVQVLYIIAILFKNQRKLLKSDVLRSACSEAGVKAHRHLYVAFAALFAPSAIVLFGQAERSPKLMDFSICLFMLLASVAGTKALAGVVKELQLALDRPTKFVTFVKMDM